MADDLDYLNQLEIASLLKVIHDERDNAIVTLFLTTGLFISELVNLTIENIDWDKKTLHLKDKKRPRTITLNDQALNALAHWSKQRPDGQTNSFFLTTKGTLKGLSARSVDHILRTYGKEAGIKKTVNALLLRNTFAVRLFQTGISEAEAAKILGISDAPSLKRYQMNEPTPSASGVHPSEEGTSVPDTRSSLSRFVSKLFPTKPKSAKILTAGEKFTLPKPEDTIFGRDHLIAELRAMLNKGQSVLLTGVLGLGKTHLLKHMAAKLAPHALYLPTPTPLKPMLTQLCDTVSPDWKHNVPPRASIQDLLDYITKLQLLVPPVLIIDNLDKVKASDAEAFTKLMEKFAILGASEETHPRAKALWWKFKVVELPILSPDAAKQLIAHLTKNLSVSDYEQMENRILNLANGNPLSIVELVRQLSYKPVVTRDAVREIYHEAGVKYRDWSWMFAVIWGVIVIARFIALGSHSFEGYILAGIGTSMFMAVRMMVRRIK